MLNAFVDLFLKVKKAAFQALWEKTAAVCSCQNVCHLVSESSQ